MNEKTFNNLAIDIINNNTKCFIEVIESSDFLKKKEIIEFSEKNKNIFNTFVMIVLSAYSLSSFVYEHNQVKEIKAKLNKLIIKHPVLKEYLASYLELVKVTDINPLLNNEEALAAQNQLEDILLNS